MSRRSVGLVVVGWLLGLLTAFVLPDLTAERKTLVMITSADRFDLQDKTLAGWRVTRTDAAGSTPIVQLERPRYLAVVEQVESWWWDLTSAVGATPPRPTPAPPKPTEAPKPAAPSASPGTR